MENNNDLIEALRAAQRSVFKTCATYRMILQVFGPVPPFREMLLVEQRHRTVLTGMLRKLGAAAPIDDWETRAAIPVTLIDAGEDALETAMAHAALYERLYEQMRDPAARRIFRRMRNISRDIHQPALRRCLEQARAEEMRLEPRMMLA